MSDCGRYVLILISEGCDPVNKLFYCDLHGLPDGITGRGRGSLNTSPGGGAGRESPSLLVAATADVVVPEGGGGCPGVPECNERGSGRGATASPVWAGPGVPDGITGLWVWRACV